MGKANESIDWFNIALGLLKDNNYTQAEYILKRETSYGKATSRMWFLLGLLYFRQRKMDEAGLALDKISDFKDLEFMDPISFNLFIILRFRILMSGGLPRQHRF